MAAGSYIKLEVYDRLYRVYFYFIFLLLRLMNLPFVEKDIKNHPIFHDNIWSVSQRYSLLKNTDRIVLPRSSATRYSTWKTGKLSLSFTVGLVNDDGRTQEKLSL